MNAVGLVGLLVLPLAAAAPTPAENASVAVMPISGEQVSREVRSALDDVLLIALAKLSPHKVVSLADINAQIGQEAMKEAMGCDDVKCAAELAGAWGTRYVLWGKVNKLGGNLILTLGLIDTRDQQVVGRGQAKVKDDESLYDRAVEVAVHEVLGKGAVAAPTALPPTAGQDWDRERGPAILVHFESAPPATVIADGKIICPETPCARSLSGGLHDIEMQRERYTAARQRIVVAEGMTPVRLELAGNFGWLTVSSKPAGLRVTLDGQDAGVTPLERREVEARRWVVAVTSPLHTEATREVTVARNTHEVVELAPAPREGRLRITAMTARGDEVDASVFLDGAEIGRTPFSDRVIIGKHSVRVWHAEHGSHEQDIELSERNVLELVAKLQPPQAPTFLAGGFGYNCAIASNHKPICFGIGAESGAGDAELRQVTAGDTFACGLSSRGEVSSATCWPIGAGPAPTPPAIDFKQIAAGRDHVCGIRGDDTVLCFGSDLTGSRVWPGTPTDERLIQVVSGDGYSCGLDQGAKVHCWGRRPVSVVRAPEGLFKRIAAGRAHACGILSEGTVRCWGEPADGRTEPPPGAFVDVYAGGLHSCGLRADGSAACWGYDVSGDGFPLHGTYTQIATGAYHTCAASTDGAVECFGLAAAVPAGLPLIRR